MKNLRISESRKLAGPFLDGEGLQLAVVMHDEHGCEQNIGRLVAVSGAPQHDVRFGAVRRIQPASAEPWSFVDGDESLVLGSPDATYWIPEEWLLPLRVEVSWDGGEAAEGDGDQVEGEDEE